LQLYWDNIHAAEQAGVLTPLAAVIHPSLPGMVNRLWDREHSRCLQAIWDRAAPLHAKRLLDLGCGTGRWLNYLRDRGADVVGVDWSFRCVQRIHHLLRLRALQMSVDQLGFSDRSFDAANSVAVLQHLPPPAQVKALREVHRVLRPGGWFCLLEACSMDSAPHMFPHPPEEWRAMAQEAGFEVIASVGSFFGLLLRGYFRFRHAVRMRVVRTPFVAADCAVVPTAPARTLLNRLQAPLLSILALICYPVGRLLGYLPGARPLHCALLLRRSPDTPEGPPARPGTGT
jgi:SAM-dependent methyltransferase